MSTVCCLGRIQEVRFSSERYSPLREGGIGAQFFAVYVAADYVKDHHSARRTLEMIDTVRHDIIERYPNDFALALTARIASYIF